MRGICSALPEALVAVGVMTRVEVPLGVTIELFELQAYLSMRLRSRPLRLVEERKSAAPPWRKQFSTSMHVDQRWESIRSSR